MDPSRITISWLAGFFDGEGSVHAGISNSVWTVRISIAQKDINVLSAIQSRFGGRLGAKYNSTGHKCHQLRWGGRSAKQILTEMLPHLVIKKERAEIALRIIDLIGTGDENWNERMLLSLQIQRINQSNESGRVV